MKQSQLKLGDVVFFKEVSEKPDKRGNKMRFNGGFGFAMMLGVVAPFARPPEEKHLGALMGQAGYISFDDVARFLGPEQGALCVKKIEETVKALFDQLAAEKQKSRSGLITAAGAPLSVAQTNNEPPTTSSGAGLKIETEH